MIRLEYLLLLCSVLLLSSCNRPAKLEDFETHQFTFKDREAVVVVPKVAAEGNPWIWRPAFFGAFPSVDLALLEEGFHVVYYDLTHLYGSPRALELGTAFYNYVVRHYGLSSRVTLEGFSRGGLFVFNWANKNAGYVACIYADAPVCDVFSWPGRKNTNLWADLLSEWQLADEQMAHFEGNPIDNLEAIAKANIPIITVCGDSDDEVPYEENMGVLKSRYEALGGKIELILKKGGKHHPHSLSNPRPIVDFIIKNQ
ncbi:hypothetical protein D0T84_15195 [Dysgonomonas sp. 521]|nr:hypothetical protein [Dysgonomonas sp. 521]